jgi:hypothetical protein
METIKFSKLQFKRPFLKDVMEMALKEGLNVYVNLTKYGWKDDDILTYFLYNKDDLWGYCQLDWFSGMDLSCKYRPCREHGSGRQIYGGVSRVTKDMLFEVLAGCRFDFREHNCQPYDINKDSITKYTKVEL